MQRESTFHDLVQGSGAGSDSLPPTAAAPPLSGEREGRHSPRAEYAQQGGAAGNPDHVSGISDHAPAPPVVDPATGLPPGGGGALGGVGEREAGVGVGEVGEGRELSEGGHALQREVVWG